MIEPNIKFAKFLFGVILSLLVIIPFIAYSKYISIKARCTPLPPSKEIKPDNKKIKIIITIAVLAGLSAQMMNYSYSFFRLKPSI